MASRRWVAALACVVLLAALWAQALGRAQHARETSRAMLDHELGVVVRHAAAVVQEQFTHVSAASAWLNAASARSGVVEPFAPARTLPVGCAQKSVRLFLLDRHGASVALCSASDRLPQEALGPDFARKVLGLAFERAQVLRVVEGLPDTASDVVAVVALKDAAAPSGLALVALVSKEPVRQALESLGAPARLELVSEARQSVVARWALGSVNGEGRLNAQQAWHRLGGALEGSGLALAGQAVPDARLWAHDPWVLAWAAGASVVLLLVIGFNVTVVGLLDSRTRRMQELASIDPLTGLPNRRSFTRALERACGREDPDKGALMFLDLDNFKKVNDELGHAQGDALLVEIAQRLRSCVRSSDEAFRLGGDEFTVLLRDAHDAATATKAAQRILGALNQPVSLDGGVVAPGASIGIALLAEGAASASDLMRYADMAMYAAKRAGKGACRVYSRQMGQEDERREQLGRELRDALDRQQMHMFYQPQVVINESGTREFEALLRWSHPRMGWVGPDVFLPAAENTGVIVELGAWAVGQALRQLRQWKDAGIDVRCVSVNISARQLTGRLEASAEKPMGLVDYIGKSLRENGLPGRCLRIELGEDVLVENTKDARRVVQELRRLGVGVMLDNFGTGNASLSLLQKVEVDGLKLDRSFVQAIHTLQGEKVCWAIVTMAQSLGLRVVAQGVETDEQALRLIEMGCLEHQGFLYAAPLPPAQAVVCEPVREHRRVEFSETLPAELTD